MVVISRTRLSANRRGSTSCICANFNDAATYLITQIYQIFSDIQPISHERCGRGQPNICHRNVAKAKTWNGKKLFNGVNIIHTERYFPAKEWTQLGPQVQNILNDCPKRKAKNESLMIGKKSKLSSAST